MIHHDPQAQPGLEVAPEQEAPQVVHGPVTMEKGQQHAHAHDAADGGGGGGVATYDSKSPAHSPVNGAYAGPPPPPPPGVYPPEYHPGMANAAAAYGGGGGGNYWNPQMGGVPQQGGHEYDYQQQFPSPPAGYNSPLQAQPPHHAYPPPPGQPGQPGQPYPAAVHDAPRDRIMGLERKKFWLIAAPLLGLIVIALAIGLGVGLGANNKSSSSGDGSSSSTSPTTSPTATPSLAPNDNIHCPASNGTTVAGDGGAAFLVVCNVDYNGNNPLDATTDIGSQPADTVEKCIDVCAHQKSCAGAGFGSYEGANTCFLKGKLGTSQSAPNWFTIIKQNSTSSSG